MDWDMLQKTCLAFQVIYESNPFEYSTLCVVTNSDQHWIFGSKIPLNAGPPAFGKLWSVGFYLGPGKVMIQSSRPSSTFSTAGWRHLGGGGGEENLIIDWLTDAVSWLQSTQPSFVVLFNSQLANFAPPTPIVLLDTMWSVQTILYSGSIFQMWLLWYLLWIQLQLTAISEVKTQES